MSAITSKHREIRMMFSFYFPNMRVKGWWTKGSDAIRVRTALFAEDLVFTWGEDGNWSLVTVGVHEDIVAKLKELYIMHLVADGSPR